MRRPTCSSIYASHLGALIDRLNFLDEIDRKHGSNAGRRLERAAIKWSIDELGNLYAGALPEAIEYAEERARWRAEQSRE